MTIFLTEQEAARLGIKGAKGRRSAKHAREARPNLPRAERAERGGGDRQKGLDTLARHGWTCTHSDGVSHWMTGAAGTTPRVPSYREMLDATLELVKGHS